MSLKRKTNNIGILLYVEIMIELIDISMLCIGYLISRLYIKKIVLNCGYSIQELITVQVFSVPLSCTHNIINIV